MKILAFSDLHGDKKALSRIVSSAKRYDMLVCAGDLTNFQEGLSSMLKALDRAEKPVVIIPGNHENPRYFSELCSKLKNVHEIHKKALVISRVLFLGYGSGGFSQNEQGFSRMVLMFAEKIKKHPLNKVVMVVHAPPYNTALDLISGRHIGNKDFSEFLKQNRVDLLLCGHFHENAGVIDNKGKTAIINPGKFMEIEIR